MSEESLQERVEALFAAGPERIALTASTGNEDVDAVLKGVVGVFEDVFPGRVRGYYVVGSYANGTAVGGSDLDFHPLFKGEFGDGEAVRVYAARDICNGMAPLELNVDPWPEDFAKAVYSGIFPLVSLPVFGEDIRPSIPLPPLEAYRRRLVNVGGLLKARQASSLRFPLAYPEPDDELYGYGRRGVHGPEGPEVQGTRGLIGVAYSIVLGRLGMDAARYIAGKAEAFALYGERYDDEWAGLANQIWERCRQDWQYRIPAAERDREELRAMCRRLLAWENFYLGLYRDFSLKELAAPKVDWPYGDGDYTAYCLARLESVCFPGDEGVFGAVKPYLSSPNPVWRRAAAKVMEGRR